MSECPENRNDLPVNSDNLCWWHSINFALFHRKRESLETANWSSLSALKNVYDFYKDTDAKVSLDDLNNARQSLAKVNTADIKFNTDQPQSAEEYMNILSNDLFQGSYYSIPSTGTNDMSWKLYDIYLACARLPGFDGPIHINYPEGADLLVLGFDRGKRGDNRIITQIDTPVEILNTIILPNKNLKEPLKFQLDALVIRKSWGHYESCVKCSNSGKWLYNKISSQATQVLEQYESFESMVNQKDLQKNVILSIYSA